MKDQVLEGYNLYIHLLVLLVIVSLVFAAARQDGWAAILRDSGRWFIRLALPLAVVGFLVYVLFFSMV